MKSVNKLLSFLEFFENCAQQLKNGLKQLHFEQIYLFSKVSECFGLVLNLRFVFRSIKQKVTFGSVHLENFNEILWISLTRQVFIKLKNVSYQILPATMSSVKQVIMKKKRFRRKQTWLTFVKWTLLIILTVMVFPDWPFNLPNFVFRELHQERSSAAQCDGLDNLEIGRAHV